MSRIRLAGYLYRELFSRTVFRSSDWGRVVLPVALHLFWADSGFQAVTMRVAMSRLAVSVAPSALHTGLLRRGRSSYPRNRNGTTDEPRFTRIIKE